MIVKVKPIIKEKPCILSIDIFIRESGICGIIFTIALEKHIGSTHKNTIINLALLNPTTSAIGETIATTINPIINIDKFIALKGIVL